MSNWHDAICESDLFRWDEADLPEEVDEDDEDDNSLQEDEEGIT